MKATKITEPRWLGYIGPRIKEYVEKINVPGITYESMFTSLSLIIQRGGNASEFWIVFDEGKPFAFATWCIKELPYLGTTYLSNIYSWTKNQEPVDLLADEIVKFGFRNRSLIFHCDVINDILGKRLEMATNKLGYSAIKMPYSHYLIEKKEDTKNESNN